MTKNVGNGGSEDGNYPMIKIPLDSLSESVDFPVASIARSKFYTYPEYYTSLDDLPYISSEGLGGAYEVYKACIQTLEFNVRYRSTV